MDQSLTAMHSEGHISSVSWMDQKKKNFYIPYLKAFTHYKTPCKSLSHTARSHLVVTNSIAPWIVTVSSRVCRLIVQCENEKLEIEKTMIQRAEDCSVMCAEVNLLGASRRKIRFQNKSTCSEKCGSCLDRL